MIWGYHYFWKHPYIYIRIPLLNWMHILQVVDHTYFLDFTMTTQSWFSTIREPFQNVAWHVQYVLGESIWFAQSKMVQIVPASHCYSSSRESSHVSLNHNWSSEISDHLQLLMPGFGKLRWLVQLKRYGHMLWKWSRCRQSKRISLFPVRRKPISEGTIGRMYTRCQDIRFNTWKLAYVKCYLKISLSLYVSK